MKAKVVGGAKRSEKRYRKNWDSKAFDRSQRTDVPVFAGEDHEVKIESVSTTGKGVAFVKGFKVLVVGAKKGEQCTAHISLVTSTHAEAKKTP